jgi:hypothetical protein
VWIEKARKVVSFNYLALVTGVLDVVSARLSRKEECDLLDSILLG